MTKQSFMMIHIVLNSKLCFFYLIYSTCQKSGLVPLKMSFLPYFEKLVSLIGDYAELGYYLIKQSSVMVAEFAAVGAFFAGPVGAFIGGVAGPKLYAFFSGDIKTVTDVLNGFSLIQKENVVLGVQALVGVAAVGALVAFMAKKKNRERIYAFLEQFFQ